MDAGFPRSVVIYGAGLMGTSFALALKRRPSTGSPVRIYAVDRPDVLQRASLHGAFEGSGESQDVDLIVLAAPVGQILKLLETLEPGRAIILDLGSTKVEICKTAERRRLPFIGGHPMTGSERSGPEAASAELFKGAPFFLCPIASTPGRAAVELEDLIRSIGGTPLQITAEEHDRIVARLSHLPQLVSTLLADYASDHRDLAGPGWKSLTRLAASPFHVWRDILQTSGYLPGELRAFIERLQSLLTALEANDLGEIEAVFRRANRAVSEETRE